MNTSPSTTGIASRPISLIVILAVSAAALGRGAVGAWVQWWTTDDAFISFRYADNLVHGLGLVFNEGQRVEGYTNFLWTLWAALGLRLGFDVEAWANGWGIAFYLGAIVLLLAHHRRVSRRAAWGAGWFVPVAALGAAFHRDWNVFATSGLETSAFCFLLLATYVLVVHNLSRPALLGMAGSVAALASMTRPDGVIPAVVMGVFLLWRGVPRWRAAAAFGSGFAVLWLPFIAWRLWYYGDLFPNTYYAKSAYLTWWSQGGHYLWLYARGYWPLLLGPALLVFSAFARRSSEPGDAAVPEASRTVLRDQALLALAVATAYSLYVARVGGDFMYARMLIPATPFYLLVLEAGVLSVTRRRPVAAGAWTAAVLLALTLTPPPVTGTAWSRGVANERMYYSDERVAGLDHSAKVLGRFFDGLPVRVAFYGDEARVVYRARFAVAIESHAGLTEPEVAHQELQERGRVGHEKHASIEYLIDERKAHFTFSRVPGKLLQLRNHIPEIAVSFDRDVHGQVLHWDPELMRSLRARGAIVPDFPAAVDALIARLDELPREQVALHYQRIRRFYFAHVDDPLRERAFTERLARPS